MKEFLIKSLFMAAVALGAQSCLFQDPEMTEDGELGIDPTDVAVSADITFDMTIPALEAGGADFDQPSNVGTAYKRRVIVEALTDGRKPVTRTILLDIDEDETEVVVPVSMRLAARNYTFAVWSDYVQVAENGGIDSSYFYNATRLPNIYMGTSYRGNNNYKDSAYGSIGLNLSSYASTGNARVSLDMPLKRPVGRLQLVANDTRAFLKKISDGVISGTSFALRVSYPGYLCMGYNIELGIPRHSLMYMSYEQNFSTKNMVDGEPFALTFDYLFAEADKNTAIPMQLEILDSKKTTVLASASFTAYCRADYFTTVTYGFLTATDDQGIHFDTDFDGSGTVVIVPSK